MKPIYLFIMALLLCSLAACTAPRTTVTTDGQSGSILFKATPGSADVYLDENPVGKAREFNRTASVMKVSPGTHTIRVSAPGYKDYVTKVYISDSQEVIDINLESME